MTMGRSGDSPTAGRLAADLAAAGTMPFDEWLERRLELDYNHRPVGAVERRRIVALYPDATGTDLALAFGMSRTTIINDRRAIANGTEPKPRLRDAERIAIALERIAAVLEEASQ
jgi:hypothetical protein